MGILKPLNRPVRVSMIIAYSSKLPEEEAAAIIYDEFKSTLMEMDVCIDKVVGRKDTSLESIRKLKGMSEKEAFSYLVDLLKRSLLKLGVDRSLIRALRFE